MAAKTTITIDDDVRDVLARSTFDKEGLKLPEQLDRKLYLKTMKVLEAYGGQWNKKRGGIDLLSHQLPKLKAALETGVAVREQVVNQAYYTPDNLADELVARVFQNDALGPHGEVDAPPDGLRVLEPSAGEGALIKALRKRWPMTQIDVVAVERDIQAHVRLHDVKRNAVGSTRIIHADFLACMPGQFPRGHISIFPLPQEFDLVLMNSPWTNGQAADHLRHAMKFLRNGGRLGAIVPPNLDVDDTILCTSYLHREEWRVPKGAFKVSGTMVAAKIVVVQT